MLFKIKHKMISDNTVPHGLIVVIRCFHMRGRGSIPCGGVFKDAVQQLIRLFS